MPKSKTKSKPESNDVKLPTVVDGPDGPNFYGGKPGFNFNGAMKDIFSKINEYITSLNSSKYFAGIVMIMLNLGGKVVQVQFSKSTQEYLKFNVGKQLFVFSMAWMGTRDIYTALVLTAVFTILSEHLFNEESSYCIVPENMRMLKKAIDTNNDGVISDEEIANAMKVLEKAKNISAKSSGN